MEIMEEGLELQLQSQPITLSRIPLEQRIENAIKTVEKLIEDGHACALTFSSGKDSSCTTLLGLEAIRRSAAKGIKQAGHYISSSSTSVENPEIENALLQMHEDIAAWADTNKLPVTVRLVEPHAAARFVVNIVGRGTLPRFVENGSNRTCSTDWKVKPQQRLAQEIMDEVMALGFKETVSILGTRLDESAARNSAMLKRGDQALVPVRNPNGYLTLSLIADWKESDVWDFLSMFLLPETAPFDAYVKEGAIRRMLDLYRDGNEGTCGMFLSDGKKAPCGSRFGCWSCTISGQRDKSMESMLNADSRYEYMRGLSKFRNYLVTTQWDMSRRELVGRTVSDAGYLPVRPDVYNLRMRRDLLGYLLTLDVLEEERAEQMQADLATGRAESTPENLRMAETQFQVVRETDLVLVDFYWSMHHYASSAYPALQVWYEVKTLGRRYPVPTLEKVERKDIITKRWFPVGAWDREVPTDGLRDYKAEQWNPYLHPERLTTHLQVGNDRIAWHESSDTLEVNAAEAVLFLDTFCTTSLAIETQNYPAIESARFWLNEGIISLPKGMAGRYQTMAKRGQYFANLAERLNLTPAEMDGYLMSNSINDEAHNLLLGSAAKDAETQFLLF